MRDLTKDSIVSHLLSLAAPVALSMIAQIAYQVIDLYFVTKISVAATAGVNAAGNAMLVVSALSQVLNVGTAVLIAHAAGRKDQADANSIFNQSISLAWASGVLTMALFYFLMRSYLRLVAADSATTEAGATFMVWVLPGFALMIPMAALGSALRGIGTVRPYVVIYIITVAINALLAPVLIAGWGTGVALGVKGAGLSTSISIAVGIVLFGAYLHRFERYLRISRVLLWPRLKSWQRIVYMGLPAGGEFALMFLSTAVAYYAIRNFGAVAQAGFGIGSRLLQVILLPGMAIGFAAGPIAGQNFGAKNALRVRQTFGKAVLLGTVLMTAITCFVQWRPTTLVSFFEADAAALDVAAMFLQLMSWTFVVQSFVYVCSNVFQGLGNTLPPLISSGVRFLAFAVSAVWLSMKPQFSLEHVWYLSIGSVVLQAIISLCLIRIEFRKCLLPITR